MTRRACDGQWQGLKYRLDADLNGTLRAGDRGRSETWRVDCPYDVVHRSGACAIVAKGVVLLRTYGGRTALVWGDRNAERRERMIAFDGTRQATWTDEMSGDDTARADHAGAEPPRDLQLATRARQDDSRDHD